MSVGPQIIPEIKARARCTTLLVPSDVLPETRRVAEIALDLGGIPGSRHHGFTRKAGPREPWYPRGMEMRSARQLTVVSAEELPMIAAAMNIPRIEPEWIGANIVLEGIARLSWLPSGTRLIFAEASIVVEAQNAPCQISGKSVARHIDPDGRNSGLAFAFPKQAQGLRGLVASVERAGVVHAGEEIAVKVPRQSVWSAE
jgi:MOSC domain